MRFERYGAYKESGVDWLGGIPNEWGICRLKDIFIMNRGKFSHRPRNDSKMYGGEHPFLQTGDVAKSNKYVQSYTQTLSNEGVKVSRKFKKDTILMTISANIGDIGILKFDAYFPDSIIGFKSMYNIDNDFAFYFLYVLKNPLNRIKVTNTQDNLNLERLNTIFKALPKIKTQTKIANYLDLKTKKVDKEISILEQKIEKYKELKETLIAETVLRGLDKDVVLKESGIEWVGSIPEYWDVKRVKQILYKKVKKQNMSLECGSISFGKIIFKNSDKVPLETKASYQEVNIGDFVINPLNLNFDLKSLRTALSTKDVVMSQGYIILRSQKGYFKSYLKWILREFDIFEMKTFGSGVRQTINFDDIGNSLFCIPPYYEQIEIANYLDEKTSKIDNIIKSTEDKIKVLKEFRKTLINDVVTGKVKVA